MNQQQVKYTIDRINSIERQRTEALRLEYLVPAKFITDEDIIQLIKTGAVTFRSDIKRDRHGYLQVTDIFDLSEHTWHQHQRAGWEEAVAELKAQASRVRDEVMLGDNAEALRLLKEFAGPEA